MALQGVTETCERGRGDASARNFYSCYRTYTAKQEHEDYIKKAEEAAQLCFSTVPGTQQGHGGWCTPKCHLRRRDCPSSSKIRLNNRHPLISTTPAQSCPLLTRCTTKTASLDNPGSRGMPSYRQIAPNSYWHWGERRQTSKDPLRQGGEVVGTKVSVGGEGGTRRSEQSRRANFGSLSANAYDDHLHGRHDWCSKTHRRNFHAVEGLRSLRCVL